MNSLWLLLIVPVLVIFGAMSGDEKDEPTVPEPDNDSDKPIAVGDPSDPEIAELLEELNSFLVQGGMNPSTFSARELTTMGKAPGKPVAIPPRHMWASMARTIREIVQPIRDAMGIPLRAGAYRDRTYNAAVGGAPNSRHIFFQAVDLRPVDGTTESKRKLAMLAAGIYKQRGRELSMGFGAYGRPTPGNIHVDTGFQRRTWRDAQHYIARA